MIMTGLENKGVTANSPTTPRNRTSKKILPARCAKASLKFPSFTPVMCLAMARSGALHTLKGVPISSQNNPPMDREGP